MGFIVKGRDAPESCYSCDYAGCKHWETNSFEKLDDCPIIEISDEDCHMIETLKESGESVKGALSLLTLAAILRSVSPEFMGNVKQADTDLFQEILANMQNNVNINLEAEE